MARTVRNARLESSTQRAKLERERFYWSGIAQGLALGYRRTRAGPGTWTVRTLVDRASGKYSFYRLARADDHERADGKDVCTYLQALERARARARDGASGKIELTRPYTVREACADYLEWFQAQRKSYAATRTVLDAHILPRFGDRLAAELTKKEIERWHAQLATHAARVRSRKLAKRPAYREQDLADPAIARRRRATANRILSCLRAVLNYAWREGAIASDTAWRRVRPFKGADEPAVRYLETEEARRLVNACAAGGLRELVRAALLTGLRYGELVGLRVDDYHSDSRSVHVRQSKSGKPRHVPLNDEGTALFEALSAGRAQAQTLFLREGAPWGKNHQVRELAAACARAKIIPAATFHVLRHSFASWLAQRGVALQVIAELLGHSDTRITQRHYAHLSPRYAAQIVQQNLPEITPAAGKVKVLRASGRPLLGRA